jgi:hypothetical protein
MLNLLQLKRKVRRKNIRNNYLFDPARRVLKINLVEGYSADQGILWLHEYRKFITVYTLDHILGKLNPVHTFTSCVRPPNTPRPHKSSPSLRFWGPNFVRISFLQRVPCVLIIYLTDNNLLLWRYYYYVMSVKIALEWFYLSVNCQSKLPSVSHMPLLPLMLLLNTLK